MKTKTIVATIAAIRRCRHSWDRTYLVYQSKVAHISSAPGDTVPIKFANDVFTADGDRDGRFLIEVDPNTRRTTKSAPAIHIKGPVPPGFTCRYVSRCRQKRQTIHR